MKVLYVPHSSIVPYIRTRAEELAKQIARKHYVYFLSWGRKDEGNLLSKLSFRVRHRFTSKTETEYDNLRIINSPHSDFEYAPMSVVSKIILERDRNFNRKLLVGIVKEKKIDVIVNESRRLWDSTNLGVPYLYDLSDFPYDGVLKGFIRKQMVNANKLMCISNYIQKEIDKQLSLKSTIIPNGVDLKRFRMAKNRKSRNPSKKLLGVIGNHGWWSGINFLLDIFKTIEEEFELWIVGSGSEIPKAMKKTKKERIKNVKFFGGVPKNEVVKYFKAIDIGVVPFKKTFFTEAALPIKILEHTAAKKFVLATDLEELKALRLSNLVLRPRNEEQWIETISRMKNREWNSRWDTEIEEYDWTVLGKKILNLLEVM